MEERVAGAEKPIWIILSALEHFIRGHDSLAEAESEAQRLNHHAWLQGCFPTTRPSRERSAMTKLSVPS